MIDRIFYGTFLGGRSRMSPARAGYLFVIWVLVPGLLLFMFQRMVVGMVFTGMFSGLSQRMDADISFRHPFYTWTGDVGFEDLSISPREADPEFPFTMSVKRVTIDLPNLGVMQKALYTMGGDEDESGLLRVVDKLDHIGLHVEGMRFDNFDELPGILDQVGRATAAPLEAEGCVGDVFWTNTELPKLGIQNNGVDLHLTLQNVPDQLEVHVLGELVSPQSSRAEFTQHYKAPSMSAFLDAEEHVANYERLAITDDGFIAKRDAYCAKRDGVAPEEFRERHLASVRRLLQEEGMRPTEEVETVYRQYLTNGKLVVEARPNQNVKREDYHHYSVADQAMMYNGTLAAGGKPVPIRVVEVPSHLIPVNFEGSTWDLVAAEARAAGGSADSMATALAPASTPAATVPAAAPASAPAVASGNALATAAVATVAPTAQTAPAAAAKPLAQAAAAPAKVAPKVEELPAWAIPPKTTRTTVDGRPLASSLPPKGNAKRVPFQRIAFEELSQHIGDKIQITTIYGERLDGRVESVSGGNLRFRSSPAMGYAVTNFDRSKIRSIISME